MSERCTKRKLKRNTTPDEDECAIVVNNMLCVMGGHLDKLCPLETLVVDGHECVWVAPGSCEWLNTMLCGKARATQSASVAVKSVLDDLRGTQQQHIGGGSPSAGPSGSVTDAAAHELFVSLSSDDEDEGRQQGTKCKEVWRTVDCNTGDISFRPCQNHQVRRILIHIDSLPAFLRACIDAYRRSRRHVLKIPSTDMDEIIPHELLTEEDKGRISFDLRNPSWIIHYKNTPRQRKPNTTTDGLAIPQAQLDGASWTPAEYRHAICAVLKKARRTWNTLDASGAPKFDPVSF